MRQAEKAGRGQIMQDLIDQVKNLLFYLNPLRGQGVQRVIFTDTEITQYGGSRVAEKTIMDQSSS